MSRADLARKIDDRAHGGTPGNLRERAWDERNETVRRFRSTEQVLAPETVDEILHALPAPFRAGFGGLDA